MISSGQEFWIPGAVRRRRQHRQLGAGRVSIVGRLRGAAVPTCVVLIVVLAVIIGGGEVRVADVEECSLGRRLDADTRDGGYEDVELAEAGEERVEAGRFEG